jgi:hypothetical protein
VDAVINQFRPAPDDIPPFSLAPHLDTIRQGFLNSLVFYFFAIFFFNFEQFFFNFIANF